MNFQIRKAERKQAKLKIGLFGPSGAGKTFSALKLARGITEWNKIVIIDTENKSADLYSHLGEYNVLTLDPPYTPENYIAAIQAAEKSGAEVIIIDSITHEWTGEGGILEISDELSKAIKNSMLVWAKLTPRHNRFIGAIINANVHVICTGRQKQDYVMNQVEKNGKTINVPEKVGLKAITREGFDYEMTVAFDLAINHYATATKDRTGVFMDRPGFKIDESVGKEIVEWNLSGKIDKPTDEQTKRFGEQCKALGQSIEAWEEKTGKKWQEQSEDIAAKTIEAMDKRLEQEKDKKDPPVTPPAEPQAVEVPATPPPADTTAAGPAEGSEPVNVPMLTKEQLDTITGLVEKKEQDDKMVAGFFGGKCLMDLNTEDASKAIEMLNMLPNKDDTSSKRQMLYAKNGYFPTFDKEIDEATNAILTFKEEVQWSSEEKDFISLIKLGKKIEKAKYPTIFPVKGGAAK